MQFLTIVKLKKLGHCNINTYINVQKKKHYKRFGNRHLEMNLRMYISVLINETAFIDGKKHVT